MPRRKSRPTPGKNIISLNLKLSCFFLNPKTFYVRYGVQFIYLLCRCTNVVKFLISYCSIWCRVVAILNINLKGGNRAQFKLNQSKKIFKTNLINYNYSTSE